MSANCVTVTYIYVLVTTDYKNYGEYHPCEFEQFHYRNTSSIRTLIKSRIKIWSVLRIFTIHCNYFFTGLNIRAYL